MSESLIDINLDETPDRMEPIAVGIRTLDIKDIETQEDANGDSVHIVTLQVNEPDAEDHERLGWERFNFKYTPARIKFKHLVRAAGHSGTGQQVDPADLIGCTVQATVASRTYKDKDTGEMKDTTQVREFLHEAE